MMALRRIIIKKMTFDLICFHVETRLIIKTRYSFGAIQFIKSSFHNTMRKQQVD